MTISELIKMNDRAIVKVDRAFLFYSDGEYIVKFDPGPHKRYRVVYQGGSEKEAVDALLKASQS